MGKRAIVSIESDQLKFIAQVWGEEFADALIADPRWPRCNQHNAIAAAEAIVRTAITGVAAILDGGGDFKPHIGMMSATTWRAFQDSMPGKKQKSVRAITF
jgi:hypothetical protein